MYDIMGEYHYGLNIGEFESHPSQSLNDLLKSA